jgi:cell division protein FtsW (lipid II flippase)
MVLLLTPLILLIGLFNSGQSGVHRWISLGPLNWNVAFLCLPAAVVAFAATARSGSRWTWWAALVIQLELCLQPDASQATAFAAASVVALLTSQFPDRARLTASLLFVLMAVLAWNRPDPLAPVPEVEGILKLAGAVSRGMVALCAFSLAAVTASPLFGWNHAQANANPSAIALSIYCFTCALMPLFGAFPVPLVGMGQSPIIGSWLGIGALMTVCGPARPAEA